MARVKRSVHARKKRRKVLEQAKGYYGRKSTHYRYAKEQGEHSPVYASPDSRTKTTKATAPSHPPPAAPRPAQQDAPPPLALARPHQCGRAGERALVQPVHERRPQGG